MMSKIGVPIPTTITPKVRATACDLIKANMEGIPELLPGIPIPETVKTQDAKFFVLNMKDEYKTNGVIIRCRSSASSNFKLMIFDKEGGIRKMEDSQKKNKQTVADLFFVPFTKNNISEFIPLKFHMEDRDTPITFHYLDTLQVQGNRS